MYIICTTTTICSHNNKALLGLRKIKWKFMEICFTPKHTHTQTVRETVFPSANASLIWDNVTLLQNHFDLEPSLTMELISISMHCCFLWTKIYKESSPLILILSVICNDRFLGLSSILCRSFLHPVLYLRYIAVHPTTLNACSASVRKELLIHSTQGRIWHFLYRSLRSESELQSAPPHPLPRQRL